MARLGVGQLSAALQPSAPVGPPVVSKKRVRPTVDPNELRRSARLLSLPAENDGAAVDALGDEEEEGKAAKRDHKASRWEERDAAARQLLANSRQWLEDSRASLLSVAEAGA